MRTFGTIGVLVTRFTSSGFLVGATLLALLQVGLMTKPGLEGFGMAYQPYTPIILWMPSDSDAGRKL